MTDTDRVLVLADDLDYGVDPRPVVAATLRALVAERQALRRVVDLLQQTGVWELREFATEYEGWWGMLVDEDYPTHDVGTNIGADDVPLLVEYLDEVTVRALGVTDE